MLNTSSLIIFVLFLSGLSAQDEWFKRKHKHLLTKLTPKTVEIISNTVDESADDFEKILDSILLPRVSGTQGSRKVREYIVGFLKKLKWKVQVDSFNESTPLGKKTFANIVATLNPVATRHLVVACHYDSKLNREYSFVGATDSAVPCTMMLNFAKAMDDILKSNGNDALDLTLQFIFFDGEEAFVHWTSTDSLYGSRHLASLWETMPYPEKNDDNTNELHRKDVLVLLDLLGAPDPSFYSFYQETHRLYKSLVNIEKYLQSHKLISGSGQYFKDKFITAGIEDDHIPFYQRRVSILHLIPLPFPAVWHKESDNKSNLDFATIRNLNKILWTFIVGYLHLPLDNTS